jgi:tartrate-resistant acid phosphatase type 5
MTTENISRRRMLKQTFCFSAMTMSGVSILRAFDSGKSLLGKNHFLMIGDWGSDEDMRAQQAVSNGMMQYASDKKFLPEALFLLGDNFYGSFKGGTESPRWKKQFEDMYPKEKFPGKCYTMLGNHDYDDEPVDKLIAELDYAKVHPETRWHLPSKWYRTEIKSGEKSLITILTLDSNYHNRTISLTEKERAQQMSWLKEELEKPRESPWLVVMAHHPLFSNGSHGDDDALIADWNELLKKYQVHFYFSGHDHDLQHLEFEKHPTSFVVSGGGGARIRETGDKHGPFAKSVYGFTHLEVTEKQFIVRHIDANRNVLHAFQKKLDGSWTVIS